MNTIPMASPAPGMAANPSIHRQCPPPESSQFTT